jgi:hypothetical protein
MNEAFQNEQAAKIIDAISKLRYKLSKAIKRVIWELLQNAQDSAQGLDRGVNVEIVLDDQNFSFSHSGRPFNVDDLLHLIVQTSFKERKKQNLTVDQLIQSL